jgi:hypothetical protein
LKNSALQQQGEEKQKQSNSKEFDNPSKALPDAFVRLFE